MDMVGRFEVNRIHCGDALELLRQLPDESVQCCVTSPPYWALRNYGIDGQIGMEPTPQEYISRMESVFKEVYRVLRNDGTLWLNIGDSYASNLKGDGGASEKQLRNAGSRYKISQRFDHGLKSKDLCGIPWRLAFALQAAGWYLRCDIIWSKPNPMPESVMDRPTKSHEYLFLMAKSERYYYDAEAIKEKMVDESDWEYRQRKAGGRNKRSVWEIATMPYSGAHFATYPKALVEPCILAGTKPGDVVLDPFAGSGTTGVVAIEHGRKFIGFDLNEKYCQELATPRLAAVERGQTVEQYQAGQMTIFDTLEAKDEAVGT